MITDYFKFILRRVRYSIKIIIFTYNINTYNNKYTTKNETQTLKQYKQTSVELNYTVKYKKETLRRIFS